jgi:eukaryotic-like serine/threonine-protein kinase
LSTHTLAKVLSDCTEETVTLKTAPGAVLGTLRYMSPEQRSGQVAHHTWDLWALAVTTYEMLTGFHPFEDGCIDWLAGGTVVPFTPVAKHVRQVANRWQLLFEHSFARELSDRNNSVEAFWSELQSAAS